MSISTHPALITQPQDITLVISSEETNAVLAWLRHTWASWHVQNGTSLQELQQLGGWTNFDMVLRYTHLTSKHLKVAASRIYVTNSLHSSEAHHPNLY